MKQTKIYLIGLLALLSVSCSDFLTEKPTTMFNNKQIYSSEPGAQAALNGCYAYLSNYMLYGQKLHVLLGGHSGTMTIGNTTSSYLVDLAKFDIQTNNSAVDDVYQGSYQTINATNDVILNMEVSPLSESFKNRILGEAHFIRALTYFNLVRLIGPVPYVEVPAVSVESAHRPRTSIDQIYGLILRDLEAAWTLMPDKGEQPHGRPHKYAAKTLLAKVYVAMACIKEHPGEPFDASWLTDSAHDYWKNAYDAAMIVYLDGGYSLTPNFADLWKWSNKYTKESIFELEENMATGSCSFMYHYLPGYWEGLPKTNSSNNYGRIRAMRESWDQHNSRYPGDWRLDITYIDTLYRRNMATTSDPGRLYYTYPYTKDNLPAPGIEISSSEELPYIKKYVDPNFTATDANVNVILLRYADLLLTLAEATNEIGQTQEAVGYINEVLSRARRTPAGMRPSPASWSLSISATDFRRDIMIERQLELKAELTEWFDNRRRGVEYLRAIMQNHNDKLAAITTMTYDYIYDMSDKNVKKNLLCPFPMSEISANNNITEQDQNLYY